MKKTFSNVVIIGAGFSGLSAAATLVQNGFQNVIILEARNRILQTESNLATQYAPCVLRRKQNATNITNQRSRMNGVHPER